jgi:hypothetical protein
MEKKMAGKTTYCRGCKTRLLDIPYLYLGESHNGTGKICITCANETYWDMIRSKEPASSSIIDAVVTYGRTKYGIVDSRRLTPLEQMKRALKNGTLTPEQILNQLLEEATEPNDSSR